MDHLHAGNITVRFDRDGDRHFDKGSVINWLGKPVHVLSGAYTFHFDLEGRIQRIDGFASPHSWDWLQRTMANDWIYYDKAWMPKTLPPPAPVIGDTVWAVNGRTDLPMLHGHNGIHRDYAAKAFAAFDDLIIAIRELVQSRPEVRLESGGTADVADEERFWGFLGRVAVHDREELQNVADRLGTIRGHMAVLPPDTILVDYRVLLVKVMDGCPNACGFCVARGESAYALRDKADIDRQIAASAEAYGADLYNYNSVVLGECDALASPLVEYAATKAFEVFRCGSSYHAGSNLFLFTTNKTLQGLPEHVFDMLESLPFETVYINIGWEAATDAALSSLKKRQTAREVLDGMGKAGSLNRRDGKVRVSGNFIASDEEGCEDIVESINESRYCGQLYISPLHGRCSSAKALSNLRILDRVTRDVRAYLYTMQRL